MEWISVKESLPGIGKNVIVCSVRGTRFEAFLDVHMQWTDGFRYFDKGSILYWMPFPEPPDS